MTRWAIAIGLAAMVAAAGCAGGEHRAARDLYNDGLGKLDAQKYDDAEKAFLDAINQAGVDPELRFRAAFDLAMAYAEHARSLQGGQDADFDQALHLLHQAEAWFQDALRIRPDADAKANLAIVKARAESLADDVNRGKNGLEPRLARLIDAQRGVRDQVQDIWDKVVAAGKAADPTAQRATYDAVATHERTLLADAGTILDMAGDEITSIGGKAKDKRTDEEQARLVQLQNLDLYVQDARTALSDARHHLHELAGDAARDSAELALDDLKRAREQLQDPITVLKMVAQDQLGLGEHTDPGPGHRAGREAGRRRRGDGAGVAGAGGAGGAAGPAARPGRGGPGAAGGRAGAPGGGRVAVAVAVVVVAVVVAGRERRGRADQAAPGHGRRGDAVGRGRERRHGQGQAGPRGRPHRRRGRRRARRGARAGPRHRAVLRLPPAHRSGVGRAAAGWSRCSAPRAGRASETRPRSRRCHRTSEPARSRTAWPRTRTA